MCACRLGEWDPDPEPDAPCQSSGPEVCNGRDDDCDGRLDELAGVCQQAGTCFAGRLACATGAGLPAVVCRDDTGVDRPMTDVERCSGVDDDCDGRIDEGFDLTADPANCGGCGRDCAAPLGWPLEGVTFACDGGRCVVEACGPGLEDVDGDPGNGCECAPDAPDRPDARFSDADCDGILDEDPDVDATIFVHPGGRDDGDGSPGDPVATLDRAAALARASGRDEWVIAAGEYDLFEGALEDDPRHGSGWPVPDGARLRGGFVVDGDRWHRPPRGDSRTVLTGGSPVLRFERLGRTTLLDGVDVSAAPGADGRVSGGVPVAGTNSVAIVARDVGEHLVIANCSIESDDGGRGHRGVAGDEGRLGGDGGRPGALAAVAECAQPERPAACGGLRGVTRSCGSGVTVPVGGNGGPADGPGLAGAAWVGTAAAPGGAPMAVGASGADGSPGRPGAVGPAGGSLSDDGGWSPAPGTGGGVGVPGNGGGGGGGATVYGGGGGGGGGCPGGPGSGASGGHGAFALIVIGGRVHLLDVPDGDRPGRLELIAGRGGPGGTGGPGGAGGPGGRGGQGAPDEGPCPGCASGAVGGLGGRGGCGGHGGPGSGGPSFAVLRVPPPDGHINDSRVVFLRSAGDPLDPARRRPVEDSAAAVEVYLSTNGGGSGGPPGEGPLCPATTQAGSPGISAKVGCCVATEDGRCAPLGSCAP